jgi:hypothetical protein
MCLTLVGVGGVCVSIDQLVDLYRSLYAYFFVTCISVCARVVAIALSLCVAISTYLYLSLPLSLYLSVHPSIPSFIHQSVSYPSISLHSLHSLLSSLSLVFAFFFLSLSFVSISLRLSTSLYVSLRLSTSLALGSTYGGCTQPGYGARTAAAGCTRAEKTAQQSSSGSLVRSAAFCSAHLSRTTGSDR